MKTWVVRLIIFFNVIVYFAWLRAAPGDSFMEYNFLVSWDALLEGRYWTLLTSEFSHSMFFHIFLNMYVLLGFGSVVEYALGSKRFIFFYLVAAAIASLSHSLVSAYLMNEPGLSALGASGAVAGVVLLFSLMYPREKILIFGLIPMPAIWGALAMVGIDLWGMFEQTRGGGLPIGHGAHLGGALTGFLYYALYVRRRLMRRRAQRASTGGPSDPDLPQV